MIAAGVTALVALAGMLAGPGYTAACHRGSDAPDRQVCRHGRSCTDDRDDGAMLPAGGGLGPSKNNARVRITVLTRWRCINSATHTHESPAELLISA